LFSGLVGLDMKTSDLVTRLADGMSPVERDAVSKQLYGALITGLAGGAAFLVVLYGIRSDMPQLILTTMFWARLAFPLAGIASALKLAERLGRPGAQLRYAWIAVPLPIAPMELVAISVVLASPPGYRLGLVLGTTARVAIQDIVTL